MMKSIFLFLAVTPALACPINEASCKSLCKPFSKEVPRPTIYNWCQIGCRARVNNQKNEGACRFADLPRPTTTNACNAGWASANHETSHCDEKVAARQAAHDAEVARKEKEAAASDPVDVADVAAAQREAQDLIDSSAAKVAEEGEKNTMAAANAESAKAAAAGTSAVVC